MRQQLERDPRAELRDASRRLGLSTRVLQRRLAEEDTSFRRELIAARVRVAQELLADDTVKMDYIAHTVGCASLSHFSTMFRRATQRSPSDYRALHRRP